MTSLIEPLIEDIRSRAKQLIEEGDEIARSLEEAGWKDERPNEIVEDPNERLLRSISPTVKRRIPAVLAHKYHHWYGGCSAFIEDTSPGRKGELEHVHAKARTIKVIDTSLAGFFKNDYMSEQDQAGAVANIKEIQGIIQSAAGYVEAHARSIESALFRVYAGDLLGIAEHYRDNNELRPAGVVAGVVLEREMRQLCDKLQIKYGKTDHDIGQFNTILFGKGSPIESATWKMRINAWYKIRNKSAHYDAQEGEPTKDEVTELINGVRSFIEFAEAQPDRRAK